MTVGKMLKLTTDLKDVYGVEFELEGKGGFKFPPVDGWERVNDGSLRHGKEYVLERPMTLQDTIKAIMAIKEAIPKKYIDDNGYAGTHVHVNVSDLTFTQLFNFILTFLSMESVLASRYYGEDRQGNLFCLRLQDAEYFSIKLLDAVTSGKLEHLKSDTLRYSSLNTCSLFKYGTVEFRGLRGDGDFDRVCTWVRLLDSIKQFAKQVEDPVALLTMFSITQVEFVYNFIPDLTNNELNEVLAGVRRIQDIAYAGADKW